MQIDAVYWNGIRLKNTITAVSQSHKQIVRFAKENDLNEIAIAEDDVLFTSLNSWKYFLEKKPKDFDLYLGGIYTGHPHFNDVPNLLYSFTGFHLYIIRKKFYDTFISVPETSSIDALLSGMGAYFLCNPMVAKQRNGYSFHRKKEVDDDHYLVGKKFLLD